MKIGTKSILYGAHCFFIHPWFVARAWYKLYGFPWDPRLWACFFFHDLGYIGKPNMDGPEGEQHPYLGAQIVSALFDGWDPEKPPHYKPWYNFCLYHSRFLAKQHLQNTSTLCVADKYSFCITPRWLYLFLVNLTGEIHEYMKLARASFELNCYSDDVKEWHHNVCIYLEAWVREHKDGRPDTWTQTEGNHTEGCTCSRCGRSPAEAAVNFAAKSMEESNAIREKSVHSDERVH